MTRTLLVAALLLGVETTGWAGAVGALPYNLIFTPRPAASPSSGTVAGQFGGVPVQGAYSGSASAGTLTLMVRGVEFLAGAYACPSSACAFTGHIAGTRVSAMQQSTLTRIGQATSIAFPNREAWVALVSAWANARLGDQAASVIRAASAIVMPQSIANAPNGPEPHNEAGGGNGGGGGGGMGGSGH